VNYETEDDEDDDDDDDDVNRADLLRNPSCSSARQLSLPVNK